ncbi:MAG: redox-regulated ATPase YchF [Parcubacteria group bacterium]|nr:redox-regulated ATPase YchF [Parcubacteria group bacterium]
MSKLSIGIVGLPNVGKSTLFKVITKQSVVIANYPFATIDPNVGVVPVPDERLTKLAVLSNSKQIIPAVVEFYDIAGLVKGANQGEGLGNQFLSHIREVRAVVQVVRCFVDHDIIHVETGVDPLRDIEIINTELILKDLETVEKRMQKLEGEARTGDKQKAKDFETATLVRDGLRRNILARNIEGGVIDEPIITELSLLTSKPQIYLFNGDEEDVPDELKEYVRSINAGYLVANVALADDIHELIKKAYEVLGLISFLTTGGDETRAWTITQGMKAPQAAGVIHTDFEHKFIRAETIAWDKLLEAGGWSEAKQRGWLRVEGKEYVMQDGDVVEIRHG